MSPTVRRLGAAFAAIVSLVLLAGCAGSGPAAEPAAAEFPKNRETWALPLDSYAFDPLPASHAGDLLTADCMKRRGYDRFPVTPVNLDAPGPENTNSRGMYIFSLKSAKKWGYLEAPSKRIDPVLFKKQMRAFLKRAGAGVNDALTACTIEANSELDKHGNQTALQMVAGFLGEFDPYKDPSVVETAKAWHECMRPKGIAELPKDPEQMVDRFLPESEDRDGGELSESRDDLAYTGKVPEEERRVATMDAECQESSGYVDALYDAHYNGELKVYSKHEDELKRLKEQIDKYQAAMRQIIDQNS